MSSHSLAFLPAPTPRRSHSSVHPDIILFQTGSKTSRTADNCFAACFRATSAPSNVCVFGFSSMSQLFKIATIRLRNFELRSLSKDTRTITRHIHFFLTSSLTGSVNNGRVSRGVQAILVGLYPRWARCRNPSALKTFPPESETLGEIPQRFFNPERVASPLPSRSEAMRVAVGFSPRSRPSRNSSRSDG